MQLIFFTSILSISFQSSLHTHMPSASVHLKQTISSEFWYTSIIKCEIILPHIPLSMLDGTDSCHKILCSKELPVVWMTRWEYPISFLHLKGQVHHIIKVQILQLVSLCSRSDSSNNCEMSFSVNFLLFASLGRECKILDFLTLFNESFKKKKGDFRLLLYNHER